MLYWRIICIVGGAFGEEDCLFLDVTVPGGISPANKKAVMIYIHGGGYLQGSGMSYIGGPLAVRGDVIVVAINYRLGVFGFLYEGPGMQNDHFIPFLSDWRIIRTLITRTVLILSQVLVTTACGISAWL